MEGRPWRTLGLALCATVLAVVVLNAQFFWLTFQHALSPSEAALPEPQSAVAVTTPAQPAAPASNEQVVWVGISNADINKIPVGLTNLTGVDTDSDGLPDTLERALGIKPDAADTDGDKYNDRNELAINRNPLGAGKLPVDYTFAAKQKGRYFVQVKSHGQLWYVSPRDAHRYLVPSKGAALTIAASLAAPAASLGANMLSIPSLSLTVPVVYVNEAKESAYQDGLRNGVVHYPGTAAPGGYGNGFIFGHSSDYRWSGGSYKTVFAVLPQIAVGATITFTGSDATPYTYKVFQKTVVAPSDVKYLSQYDYKRRLLTLQTSYPVGTALARYIVLSELVTP